jgi:hypothetical protein
LTFLPATKDTQNESAWSNLVFTGRSSLIDLLIRAWSPRPEVYHGHAARKLWLSGDVLDLAYLATALPAGDAQVIKDGDRFYMTSLEADNVADAHVPAVARKLVTRINGIGRLQNANFRSVEFADAYDDDAGVTVVGATAKFMVRTGDDG